MTASRYTFFRPVKYKGRLGVSEIYKHSRPILVRIYVDWRNRVPFNRRCIKFWHEGRLIRFIWRDLGWRLILYIKHLSTVLDDGSYIVDGLIKRMCPVSVSSMYTWTLPRAKKRVAYWFYLLWEFLFNFLRWYGFVLNVPPRSFAQMILSGLKSRFHPPASWHPPAKISVFDFLWGRSSSAVGRR